MLNFLANIFDENKKTLNNYQTYLEKINALESEMASLSDEALAAQTSKFKGLISVGKSDAKTEAQILEEILPEAFATVREVSKRVLGMRHFDVQILAGIGLHFGKITEQKTGEGKTLTVTAPLYLNALLERGVHLVTVNDYLSEVGAGWMGAIYHFLGLSTAVIVHDQAKMYNPNIDSEERGDERLEHFENISRQEAYGADITYGTNNEFGFDYLRDNMVQEVSQMVQRSDKHEAHYFAIVDEADSILIDEARTPLIISAPDSEPTDKYYQFATMVDSLVRDTDYKLDEKAKTATLTDLGVKRVEQKLGVKNLYEDDFTVIHYLENALRAKALYHRDKEYIVRDNQVIIVDEHTGRLMYGRRYSDGLHQSIEAKENVKIQQESRTLATVSLQNYFRMYEKLSGMTGTAATEAEEFRKIYDTEVLVVPTNVPIARQDESDLVYKTAAAKYSAAVTEVEEIHATGRPILIGTRSIDHNQIVSRLLESKKIPHTVLNAKNNEKEAFIIAQAGTKGAITVATNIAGRGVDIVLGGAKPEIKDFRLKTENPEEKSEKKAKPSKEVLKLAKELNLPPDLDPTRYDLEKYKAQLEQWRADNKEVVKLGGLAIIGTERHESRRIDNQLRGRAGRQGDPGSSRFYIALDDEIMRIFGGDQIANMMTMLKVPENVPIEAKLINRSLETAQTKVEGFFFDQRQRLVEFDDVMNKHREIIYKRRRRFLDMVTSDNKETLVDEGDVAKATLGEEVLSWVDRSLVDSVAFNFADKTGDEIYHGIMMEVAKIIPYDQFSLQTLEKRLKELATQDKIIEELRTMTHKTAAAREKAVGSEAAREIEKYVVLQTLDEKWMDHLDAMDSLRDGIWMRGGKEQVIAEYKKEAFTMFESLIGNIEQTAAERFFRVQVNPQQLRARQAQMVAQASDKKENVNENIAKEIADSKQSMTDDEVHDLEEWERKQAKELTAPTAVKGDAAALAAAMSKVRTQTQGAVGVKADQTEKKDKEPGRNDPCPCGSGKKYKHCCLRKKEL